MNDVEELFKVLHYDVEKSVSEINNPNCDFDYTTRVYLRAYASWIEGMVFVIKEILRKVEYQWHKDLPIASQLYLFEYDLKIKQNGDSVVESKKIGTKANLKGLFVLCSKVFDGFNVNTSVAEWEDVLFFYNLRDRMMHPNSATSMTYSKKEVLKCDNGRVWLKDVFNQIIKNVSKKCSV